MRYMVVERFRDGAGPVYERFAARGRMLPEGLEYLDSWVAADRSVCYQLMACDDPALLEVWMGRWADLVAFEVTPVVSSAEAAGGAAGGAVGDPLTPAGGRP